MTIPMDFLRNIYQKLLKYDSPIRMGTANDEAVKPKIIAFGNVLLDATVKIDSTEILHRYGLNLEAKGEIDAATIAKISEECNRSWSSADGLPLPHPGGSALNTVRILKKLGTESLFFGAVGSDKAAEVLKGVLRQAEVEFSFQTIPDASTGQCICFVFNEQTALYANIGASSKFTIDHLKEAQNDLEFISPSCQQIIYIEGFFLPNRLDVCRYVVDNLLSDRRRLALNLSAPYIVAENLPAVRYLLKEATFVFGNRMEFLALAENLNSESIETVAVHLINSEEFGTRKKILVITNGSKNVQIISNYEQKSEIMNITIPVPVVENVVDTTGAGDSFVAGFLHYFMQGLALEECVTEATGVACEVVTQVGCNLP